MEPICVIQSDCCAVECLFLMTCNYSVVVQCGSFHLACIIPKTRFSEASAATFEGFFFPLSFQQRGTLFEIIKENRKTFEIDILAQLKIR